MSGKKKRGAPPKYCPELVEAICRIVKNGNYLTTAAAAVGVHPGTIAEWRKKYPEFDDALKKAEAEAKQAYLACITKVAAQEPHTWQAAAWILERRWPEEFGRRDLTELAGKISLTTKWDLSKLSDEELALLEKIVAKANENSKGGKDKPPAD